MTRIGRYVHIEADRAQQRALEALQSAQSAILNMLADPQADDEDRAEGKAQLARMQQGVEVLCRRSS